MLRNVFGFSGLALVIAAVLGAASLGAGGAGLSDVGDDDAGQVLGGAYCPTMVVSSTTQCGGSVGKSTGTCPSLNSYTTDAGGAPTSPTLVPCAYCGVTCGQCYVDIFPCM